MAHGVLVDPATGRRFISELADRKIQSDAIIACGHPAITISDSHGAKFAWWGLEHSLKKGTVKKFDTIAALGRRTTKSTPAELKKTIEAFNGYVTAKKDPEFGKLILKDARPLTEGPFYAARVWPKVHHTMGGVEINGRRKLSISTAPSFRAFLPQAKSPVASMAAVARQRRHYRLSGVRAHRREKCGARRKCESGLSCIDCHRKQDNFGRCNYADLHR